MWISGAVLMTGIGLFLVAFNSSNARHVDPNASAATVPASPAARSVARRFLETAVGRQDLATAYTLVGPFLKGAPRKQWIKGINPVMYFPARNLETVPLEVKSSTKRSLLLEVGPLVAPQGTKLRRGLKSLTFWLEVDRIRGKWLVNYFMPNYTITHSGPDMGN